MNPICDCPEGQDKRPQRQKQSKEYQQNVGVETRTQNQIKKNPHMQVVRRKQRLPGEQDDVMR